MGADQPRDVLANIALFIPFGYSFARGRMWWTAVIAAAAASFGAEATQLFGILRYPSATDVTAAMTGAAAGALWHARDRRGAN